MLRLSIASMAAASAIAFTQIASAADLPPPAPVYAPPPPPVISWTGWYGGVNAGYNWGDSAVSSTAVGTGGTSLPVTIGLATFGTYNLDPNRNGFIGGGQVGFNWQFNNWVTGIEVDLQGLANNGKANQPSVAQVPLFPEQFVGIQSAQAQVSWLGTLRGRIGALINPSSLIYVTGGLAYGGMKAGGAVAAQENDTIGAAFAYLPSVGGAINSQIRAGWTLGGGWEWMFAPRWSVKAEYLYYDLGTVSTDYGVIAQCTIAVCGVSPPSGMASVHTSITRLNGDIARAGVNYHF
jgi:outer membrane immunogenic protein